MIRRLLAFTLLFAPATALAQAQPTLPQVKVVSSCGAAGYSAGGSQVMTQDTTGTLCTQTGTGGGAVTAAAGAYAAGSIVDLGTGASPAANTTNAYLQSLYSNIGSSIPAQTSHGIVIGAVEGATTAGTSGTYPVTIQGNASGVAVPVSGTFWQTTQPVSWSGQSVTAATNSSGAVSLIQGGATVAISATTSGTVQLVALSSGKSIYVTHIHVVTAAAAGFSLVYGTGTNCATGTTYLDGASGNTMSFGANGGYVAGVGLGPVYIVPASNALCANYSTVANYSGSLTYAQF